MVTKYWKHCTFLLVVLLFLSHSLYAAVNLKEIEQLVEQEKYSIVLEKALGILKKGEGNLSPMNAAALNYYVGLAYHKNNNRDMAVEYLKKVEKQYPASQFYKKALLKLADVLKDDYFQRESYLEKVFDNFPETPEAIKAGLELSKGHLDLKNYQKSVPILMTLLNMWKQGEKHPELYLMLALAYSGINDYVEAGDYLRTAEQRLKDIIFQEPDYLLEAGRIFYYNQNFKKSIAYLTKLVNVYPQYLHLDEASGILAQAYERDNNLFMSAIYLITALQKKPTDQKKKYGLMLNLGRILAQLDAPEVAKIRKNYPLFADSRKLLEMVKSNSPLFEQRRDATVLLSEVLNKDGDLESIVDNYYKFLKYKRDPVVERLFRRNLDRYIDQLESKKDYKMVLKFWVTIKDRKSMLSEENMLKLGRILAEMGMYRNAEELFFHMRRYTMYSRYWPHAKRALGRLYFQMGNDEKFLGVYREMKLEKEKEKNEFLYYLALVYRRMGKPQDEAFKKLLDELNFKADAVKDEFQYKLLEIKADVMEKDNKHSDAAAVYRDLLLYPKITDAERFRLILKIADIYYNSGNWDSALDFYNRAEKYNRNMDWILFRKFFIYKNTERKEEAAATLQKLKQEYPDSFWLRQAEKENV